MSRLFADLKLVFRQLRKSPAFTLTAILMLAFGIGATTAIFSIVDSVLLRPLPFSDSGRLVTLGDQVSGTEWGQRGQGPVTAPEIVTYSRETHSFQSLGGFTYANFGLSGIGQPAQINAARMTASVFTALGVSPLLGRYFTDQEDQHKELVTVLSYGAWKSRFNSDPHVLGTKIELDRKPYIVIGVMPRTFDFPLYTGRFFQSELWVPMSFIPDELSPGAETNWAFQMVGRLKPGITPAQAQADAGQVAQQIMRNYPPDATNFHIRPVVYPLQEITVLQSRPLLRMLFVAVAVVLLIACANLAGLLLVRAIRHQRETAVRLAIGASAVHLVWQMVLESLVLSLTGGLLGIGLAACALAIGTDFLPETLPLINEISLNWTVVAFALFLALLTGFLCGLAPGFAALRTNVNASLKEGGRSGSASGSHTRLRSTFVVAEIAIALMLLSASGLLLRSFSKMSSVDLGFRPDHVLTAGFALPQKQYSTQPQIDAFNTRLYTQLRQLPGVDAAAYSSTLPTTGDGIAAIVAEGYVDSRGPDRTVASPTQILGDYFHAIGTPLIRGRLFTQSDNADSQLVVIVNRELAERYWPGQNPIGKRMRVGTLKSGTPWETIVGEVADAKLFSPDADAADQFYQPVAQVEKDAGPEALPSDLNGNGGYIVLRSALPPEQMENDLRTIVRSIDPQLPLTRVRTMEQVVAASQAPRRFNTVVISSFALAAVLLAILGIYSVIAFSVASRVHEMAIRMALGSQRSHIVRLVLISGLKLAAIGSVLGLIGAFAASSLLRTFLFNVSPFDPLVLVLTAVAVFALSLAASVIPARRAAAVDPIQALRST